MPVRHVNLRAQVCSVVLVFVTATKLSGGTLLLGVAFMLDPQLLSIELPRIDRVIFFLFILVFFLSLQVSRGRQELRVDIALGVATAALVMTKITSAVFQIMSAFAYFYQRTALKAPSRHAFGFLESFCSPQPWSLHGEIAGDISALGRGGVVILQGWPRRPEALAAYHRVDCVVNPSLYEGLPNAVLEAMACGLSVIASSVADNEIASATERAGFCSTWTILELA